MMKPHCIVLPVSKQPTQVLCMLNVHLLCSFMQTNISLRTEVPFTPSPSSNDSFVMTSPYIPPNVPKFYDYTEKTEESENVPIDNESKRPLVHYDTFYEEPPMACYDTYVTPNEAYNAKEFCESLKPSDDEKDDERDDTAADETNVISESHETNDEVAENPKTERPDQVINSAAS